MDDNKFQNAEENAIKDAEENVEILLEEQIKEKEIDNSELNQIKKNKTEKKAHKYFFTALLGALVGVLIGGLGMYYFMGFNNITQNNSDTQQKEININTNGDVYYATAVVKKSLDSVVGIITKGSSNNAFFGTQKYEGMGSGVIVDSNGYILTNSHVVEDGAAESITVKFLDGTEIDGKLLWNNKTLDLAIVKVDKTGLPVAELGDSDKLMIGEPVVAIGNPLSLDLNSTVTSGIISGLNRSIQLDQYTVMKPLIQTDASINPGNSGGPLFNAKGLVIGINSAKITSAEGLGFSIPINIAKQMVEQVIKDGKVTDVYLGIKGVDVGIYEQQLKVDLSADHGVVIVELVKDSPAQKAQLKAGDVIQMIDEEKINDMGDIQRLLFKYKPGEIAKVQVIRDGDLMTLEVSFDQKPLNFN